MSSEAGQVFAGVMYGATAQSIIATLLESESTIFCRVLKDYDSRIAALYRQYLYISGNFGEASILLDISAPMTTLDSLPTESSYLF